MNTHARLRGLELLAALVLGFTLSAAAHAHDARIVYYPVAGSTANALRSQLDAKGPLDDSGRRFDAYTQWYVAWRYRYQPTASGCKFTEVKVSVEGTITLPRWADQSHAPQALVQKWDRYVGALRLHEEGHYAHGLDAAHEVETLGRSFQASGDCSSYTADFNARAHAILAKYRAMDATYDRDTGHGRTQGATFP